MATSHELGTRIAEIHTWLGDVVLWVAGLHAAAALYHHVLLLDGVLASMLPARLLAGPNAREAGIDKSRP